MDMAQPVAAAIGGVVGVEAAGGEGVAKVLEVLGVRCGYEVVAGFRVLRAIEYLCRGVLLGSFVLASVVG